MLVEQLLQATKGTVVVIQYLALLRLTAAAVVAVIWLRRGQVKVLMVGLAAAEQDISLRLAQRVEQATHLLLHRHRATMADKARNMERLLLRNIAEVVVEEPQQPERLELQAAMAELERHHLSQERLSLALAVAVDLVR